MTTISFAAEQAAVAAALARWSGRRPAEVAAIVGVADPGDREIVLAAARSGLEGRRKPGSYLNKGATDESC